MRARELRRQQEMRENEPAENLITPTELGTSYEMRNRVQETGSETEDDRVEPVRKANEEIVKEQEAVLDVVANEGDQIPPIPDINLSDGKFTSSFGKEILSRSQK